MDLETSSCKAVQTHGFPRVEPSPGGLLHCSETAVPPGHSAPAGQVASSWLHLGRSVGAGVGLGVGFGVGAGRPAAEAIEVTMARWAAHKIAGKKPHEVCGRVN